MTRAAAPGVLGADLRSASTRAGSTTVARGGSPDLRRGRGSAQGCGWCMVRWGRHSPTFRTGRCSSRPRATPGPTRSAPSRRACSATVRAGSALENEPATRAGRCRRSRRPAAAGTIVRCGVPEAEFGRSRRWVPDG
jgi:hypothetical protein